MTLAAVALAAALPRFFLAGDGTLALVNAHHGDRATVRYRHDDGTYDAAALARVRHVLRSGDGAEGPIALRLVELLGHVYVATGRHPLVVQSGYRSPGYNEALRASGARAAGGSLHTEGLAADVAFPARDLRPLWMKIRALDCCGAGYYRAEGFLHLDVGQPRFWEPATSKVEQNLSAGNARLFARTEYDRYAAGEPIVVTLHSLTAPPMRVAKEGALVEGGVEHRVTVEASLPEGGGCWEIGERGVSVRVTGAPAGRGPLVLRTCAPRVERTPDTFETNVVDVR
jgi:uncharacterized protein YcbK (DUF882 family)